MLHSNSGEKRNDKAYMKWIYQKFRKLMFHTANQYVSDHTVCEDLVQEGILKLCEKIDDLRDKSDRVLAGYIVSVMRNIAIDYLRHQEVTQKHVITLEQEELNSMLTPEVSPEEAMLLKEKGARLLDILQQLPHTEFLLLQGKYMLDYTDAELAKQLDCKESSIRMKLTRARRHALALLSQTDLEGDEDDDQTRTTTGTV